MRRGEERRERESATNNSSAIRPHDRSVGLGVEKIGNSSVQYRLGIFQPAAGEGEEAGRPGPIAAHGFFTHVFVDAASHKPVPIPDELRAAMEALR